MVVWRALVVAFTAVVFLGGAASMTASSGGQDIFSAAQAYERFMGRWSRRMAPLLIRFAGVRDGDVLLDVGSGTGALASALSSFAPSSRIVGIDPSAPYVALAQDRHGTALVRFEVGDAQRMVFADDTFDRTLSLLVVNFIPDAGRAVDEMARVTRRGGVVAAAVWDYGAGMEMLRVFWDEVVALDPSSADKDERHMPFCRQGELAALWRARGLQDVVEEGLTVETRFASFDDYWAPFLEKQGPAGAYVAGLSELATDALAQRLRQRLLEGGPNRSFVLTARAWVVRGVVP